MAFQAGTQWENGKRKDISSNNNENNNNTSRVRSNNRKQVTGWREGCGRPLLDGSAIVEAKFAVHCPSPLIRPILFMFLFVGSGRGGRGGRAAVPRHRVTEITRSKTHISAAWAR